MKSVSLTTFSHKLCICSMINSASKVNALQERLNEELKVIECWLPQNNLFLNVYKTEAMVFGTSPCLSNMDSFTIRVNGTSIKRVSQFKYLGVVFDEHLSWNDFCKTSNIPSPMQTRQRWSLFTQEKIPFKWLLQFALFETLIWKYSQNKTCN